MMRGTLYESLFAKEEAKLGNIYRTAIKITHAVTDQYLTTV